MIQRTRPMPRGKPPRRTPVKKVNRERRAREFARCYHSEKRVLFVKSLCCIICDSLGLIQTSVSENAHTVTGGKGRKAGYATIVPLCAVHHRLYDEHRTPLDNPTIRAAIKNTASSVEAAWRSFQEQRDTQEEGA